MLSGSNFPSPAPVTVPRELVRALVFLAILSVGIPLLLGGWELPWVGGDLSLPKGASQFRNPFVGLMAVAALVFGMAGKRRRALFEAVRAMATERAVSLVLVIGTLALVKAAFLDYAALALNAIDLSVYDSAMKATLEGRFMQAITGINHFGIHATPVLFLLLPFHAIFDSPLFSVFVHPLALAAGGYALDRLLRQNALGLGPRFAMLFAYFGCTLLSKTLHYGFHVEVFYPLFAFLLFYAIGTQSLSKTGLALLLFLSVKEDAPFYAVGILAAAALTKRLSWKAAAGLGAISLATAAFYLGYLIPANSEDGAYRLVEAAGGFGSTPSEALRSALTQPLPVLQNFFRGGWWPFLLPALGLLAQSPFFWIASLPFFGIYSLAGSGLMLGLGLYYGIPWLPIFFFGWIEGFRRDPLPKRALFFLTIATLGTTLVGSGYLVFRKTDLAEWRSVRKFSGALIQNGVVCAPGILLPQFPYSANVRLLMGKQSIDECLRDARRIVLPVGRNPYPLTDAEVDEIETAIAPAGSPWEIETEVAGLKPERLGFRDWSRKAP